MIPRATSPRLLAVLEASKLLSGRWRLAILWLLASGCRRFHQLEARLPGISAKILTQQLRQLERAGLVSRHSIPGGRKRVDYVLTDSGERLRPLLGALESFGSSL